MCSRHDDPSEQCPARWPHGLNGPGDWCQTPLSQHAGDDHHDAIGSGPWLRWCDDPDDCERKDCDLSAYNARRDDHHAGRHDDEALPGCDICDRLMRE